ncbi:MAG: hypothetical protein AAF708_09090 [Deinococcota bacterium]
MSKLKCWWRLGVVCLLMLASSNVLARGFRLNDWGVSRAEARESESYAFMSQDADTMTFTAGQTMFGVGATIGYVFTAEDQLAAGTYIFDRHAVTSRYLDDYEAIQAVLVELYGEPSEASTEWLDEYHRGNLDNYGNAVAEGDLRLETRWETPDEVIVLRLFGNEGRVMHRADYLSKTYYPLYTQAAASGD